jgi:hypothetical protein
MMGRLSRRYNSFTVMKKTVRRERRERKRERERKIQREVGGAGLGMEAGTGRILCGNS